MNRQIRQLGFVITLLFIVLFAQLNNIQVLQASKLNEDPRNNRNAVRDFSSPRGDIKTADGVILAQSVPSNDEYELLRQYPEGELFGHLTGFFSFNYGNEGLERTYNDELTGKTKSFKDIDDLLTDKVETDDLTITITKGLQQTAKEALGNDRGAVVALNPKSGEILAMYSNPSYDPNLLSSHNFADTTRKRDALIADKGQPMLPRSFRQTYPPGSTYKVVTASAAYEKRPDLVEKSYPSLGFIVPPLTKTPLHNFGGGVCGGKLPATLRVSCNTSYAQMGLDMGAQALFETSEAFGYNEVPPLDVPFAEKSVFPTPDSFKRRTPFLAYAAIGQGDNKATPLQMAMVAGAIANDGVVVKPRLLKELRDSNGNVVEQGKAEQWKRATSTETAEEMTKNMLAVVNNGTATNARIPGIQVAGKTGTAETHSNLINAWFIAFAPADDPQIAIAVVVEDQEGVSEATGGRIAAPIAQKVMKAALGK
jgi:peptidoglycan glycosyltransferase